MGRRRDPHAIAPIMAGMVPLALAYACGARTDLLLDRSPPDAVLTEVSVLDADTAEVRPDAPQQEGGLKPLCFSALPLQETDPVYFQFVVDGSGSMGSDGKWEAVLLGLRKAFEGFLSTAGAQTSVGLIVFSDAGDLSSGNGPYPSALDVRLGAYGASQHGQLLARITYKLNGGGTPMRRGLEGGYREVERYALDPTPPAPTGGRKIVVLMTDGVPTGREEKDEIPLLASQELLRGTRLFVIGIGKPVGDSSIYDPDFLSRVASAGGTRRNATCGLAPNYCHYQIAPGDGTSSELVAALNDARSRSSRACEYALAGEGTLLRDATEVLFDDGAGNIVPVLRDSTNGWTYNDPQTPTRIVISGETCQKLQDNKRSGLSIRLACEKG